jgi:hypothetical protein
LHFYASAVLRLQRSGIGFPAAAVVYVKRVAASKLQLQFASGDCMTDFDSQLYPVKLSLPLSLREQDLTTCYTTGP